MKKYLLTGVVILLPVAFTIMIITFLFDFFTEPFLHVVGPLIDMIPISLPHEAALFLARILSLLFLIAFIFLLGFLVQLFLVKTLMNWMNEILYKIPFIKTIYRVSRDVFSALFSTDGKKAFKRPVRIPFPGKPTYGIGFEAGAAASECQEKVKTPLTGVFCPTAPHPISGFFFLIPTSDVQPLDMSNEEALKFLVSCGMIVPESDPKETDEPF